MIKSLKKTKRIAPLLIIIIAAMLGSLTGCAGTNYGSPATAPSDPAVNTAAPNVSEKPSAGFDDPAYLNDTDQEEAAKPTEAAKPSAVKPVDKDQNDGDSKSSLSSADKYYGQWSVNKVLAYGAAGTYSKEDAEKLVGKKLSFSADEAGVFTDAFSDTVTVIKKPDYKIDSISGSDFLTNFRMSFDKLGIDADSVTELVISGPDAGVNILLLVKDSDTLILAAGGTYFELARVK